MQLGFFLNPDRTLFKDEVRRNLEKLKKGPVANEEDLYVTYDDTFERNTRDTSLDRNYAIKIYRMLLCCKHSLTLYGIMSALALDDSAKVLQLTRDFTYLTPNNELKFSHVSAIDYLRTYRPDHEEYSDAVCHAEMALMCIKCAASSTHPEEQSSLISSTFPSYASHFWVEHCVQLDREDRESRGVSKALFSWLVKDAGGTAFSNGFCKISGIKIAMLTASIYNLVEIALEIIQCRLSAHESLSDLLSAEDATEFPQALHDYTASVIVRYRKGWTPLIWAAFYGNEDMVELLLKYDKNPNAREPLGRTALSFAAENGHEVIVGKFILLEEKMNRDSPDSYSHTPLSYAARQGHLKTVQLLLQFGVDPNVQSETGQTPLLHAVWNGHLGIVILLLAEKKVDCDHRNKFGRTPLSYAAERGHLKIFQLLLGHGADLELKDNLHRTPLAYAAGRSNLKIVQLLLEHGADLESKDDLHRTPLAYAVLRSNLKMIQLLLEHGADLESKDEDHRTPLTYATGKGDLNTV